MVSFRRLTQFPIRSLLLSLLVCGAGLALYNYVCYIDSGAFKIRKLRQEIRTAECLLVIHRHFEVVDNNKVLPPVDRNDCFVVRNKVDLQKLAHKDYWPREPEFKEIQGAYGSVHNLYVVIVNRRSARCVCFIDETLFTETHYTNSKCRVHHEILNLHRAMKDDGKVSMRNPARTYWNCFPKERKHGLLT